VELLWRPQRWRVIFSFVGPPVSALFFFYFSLLFLLGWFYAVGPSIKSQLYWSLLYEYSGAQACFEDKVKEKWAECYMRDVFSLGVRSTQLSESFNNALKNHFKSDFHIFLFLMHFERTVEVKRAKELEPEFNARNKIARIKMSTPMLVEASKVYTSIIFESF